MPPEFRDDRAGYLALLIDDLIPVVARERLAAFCDVFVERSAFTVDEARRLLRAAQAAGLGAKLHADQLSPGGGAELAAELGAVSADHLECASEAGIAAMARAGVVAVSLPLASLYLGQAPAPARRWIEAGAAVAVATDFNPGSAPSYHLPFALTLACTLQRMTPAEALKGATVIAARAVGLGIQGRLARAGQGGRPRDHRCPGREPLAVPPAAERVPLDGRRGADGGDSVGVSRTSVRRGRRRLHTGQRRRTGGILPIRQVRYTVWASLATHRYYLGGAMAQRAYGVFIALFLLGFQVGEAQVRQISGRITNVQTEQGLPDATIAVRRHPDRGAGRQRRPLRR